MVDVVKNYTESWKEEAVAQYAKAWEESLDESWREEVGQRYGELWEDYAIAGADLGDALAGASAATPAHMAGKMLK